MPGRWLVVNLLIASLALWLAGELVHDLAAPWPLPALPTPPRASQPEPTVPVEPTRERTPPASLPAYSVIAARNLFSASRTEAAGTTIAAPVGPKPILHGVVVDGDKSRAYLEDPAAKRVFGYAVGDTVAGGRLEQIADDRVVIRRPEGALEVLLQDPSKPKPSAPAAATGSQPAAAAASPSATAQVTGPAPEPAEGQRVGTAPAPAKPRRSPAAHGPIPR